MVNHPNRSKHLFPVGLDNRGSKDHPYGYVYLAADKKAQIDGRVGFGSNRDNPDPLAIWPTRDTPDTISSLTIDRIRVLLDRAFPGARRSGGITPGGITP